jgi:transposase
MSKKRISVKKIRKILKLTYDNNLSQREIGRALNISKSVVGEYLKLFKSQGMSFEKAMSITDEKLIEELQDNKCEISDKYKSLIKELPQILKKFQYTGMTKHLAWQDYIKKYPDGYKYSRFCHHLMVWEESNNVSMKQEHKPGDKLFIDYTGKKLSYIDRKTKSKIPVEVFVAVLGCSGYTYAEASINQKQESFVRSTERALRFLGGSPNALVPDNLKSAVTRADKYDPVINPLYNDFSEHYRTVVIPARAYKPKDKPLAENGVRLIYQRVFAPLWDKTFYSLKDLNKSILELVAAHNNRKLSILDVSREELFNELEKPVLKILPPELYPIKYYENRKVAPDYHIILSKDKSFYSVPWQFKGKNVRLIYDDRNVAIYHEGERLVQHIRSYRKGSYTTLESHMPKHHQFYASWSDDKFLSWAKNIGLETERVISHLLESKRHPQQAYKTCVGILSQSKYHSKEKLNTACRMAWNFGRMNSRDIKDYLHTINSQKKTITEDSNITDFKTHKNIRGKSQYQ